MAFASDYVDVAARLTMFREQYPTGSLQPADPNRPYTIETLDGTTFIVVVAAAYRAPDDARPGIGMAYEVFPGKTNFTKGSELQNAETSAWGRAIVAALAADTKKGVASAEDVRNRQEEQKPPEPSKADLARIRLLAAIKAAGGDTIGVAADFLKEQGEQLRTSEKWAAIDHLAEDWEAIAESKVKA
jgi:hypothetical protein